MKRFLLLLVCCFTLLALTACDRAEGTWKFVEKTTDILGFVKTVKVGDIVDDKEITKDYVVIVFNKDGTGTLSMESLDGALSFTWVYEEDDDIIITGNLISFEAEIDDGYLTFEYLGSEYKLKRSFF